jgi:hypothetical protein
MMSDSVQDGGGGEGTRAAALPAGLHHGLLLQQGGPRGAGDRGSLPLPLPSRRQGGPLPLQDGKLISSETIPSGLLRRFGSNAPRIGKRLPATQGEEIVRKGS